MLSKFVYKAIGVVAVSVLLLSCSEDSSKPSTEPVNEAGTNALIGKSYIASLTSTEIQTQITNQCGIASGIAIYTGIDSNSNGVLDLSEQSNTPEIVCNGSQGISSLVDIQNLPDNQTSCADAGLIIKTGLDLNQDNILSSSEVIKEQILCGNGIQNTVNEEATGTLKFKIVDAQGNPIDLASLTKATSASYTGKAQAKYAVTSKSGKLVGTRDSLLQAINQSKVIKEAMENNTIVQQADGTIVIEDIAPGGNASITYITPTGEGISESQIAIRPDAIKDLGNITVQTTYDLLFKLNSSNHTELTLDIPSIGITKKATPVGEIHTVTNLPQGRYFITIADNNNQVLQSRYIIVPEDLPENSQALEINIQSRDSAQESNITGTLQDQAGIAVSQTLIMLKTADNDYKMDVTDNNGNFEIKGVPRNEGDTVLIIRPEKHQSLTREITPNAKQIPLGIITLVAHAPQTGQIAGYVKVQDQTSHHGIEITVADENGNPTGISTSTVSSGAFIINGLSNTKSYQLTIGDSSNLEYQSIQTQTIDVVAGKTTYLEKLQILNPKKGSLVGIVQDDAGTPVINAIIQLQTKIQTHTAITDAQGQYQLQGVLAGTHQIQASKDGYGVGSQTITIQQNIQTVQSEAVQIQRQILTGKIELEGQVANQHAGTIVNLVGAQNVAPAVTDNLGNFTLFGVVKGNYQLQISKAGYLNKDNTISVLTNNGYVVPYTIKLTQSIGQLSGKITLQNKTDHSGTLVSIASTSYSTSTNSAGEWSMTLPEGSYASIQYSHSNYVSQSDATTTEVSATAVVTKATTELVSEVGSVIGIVKDGDSQVIQGAKIIDSVTGQFTESGADGIFTLNSVVVGTHNLNISYLGYKDVSIEVDVTAGEESNLQSNPIILLSYQFTGKIIDISNNPVADVTLTLDGKANKTTATILDGSFVFDSLLPGNYQLLINKDGYNSKSFAVFIPADNTSYSLGYDIPLDQTLGSIKGISTLADKVDHSGVLVELLGTGYKTYSDALGNWTVAAPVANYSNGVRFSKNLYQSTTLSETVTVTNNGVYTTANAVLTQLNSNIELSLSSIGSCTQYEVSLTGIDGLATGFTANYTVQSGNLKLSEAVPLGNYTGTVKCIDSGWETANISFNLQSGNTAIVLDAIELRQSYVVIEEGLTITNKDTVSLAIGSSDAVEMRITEGASDTGWITFVPTYNFNLSGGDALKTVVVQFKDSNAVELASVQDEITKDQTLTINSFTATGAATSGDTLHFALDLNGELNATVKVDLDGVINNLPLIDSGLGGDTTANDGIYERDFAINTPIDINNVAIANVIDLAGNTQTINSADNVVLNTAPTISGLTINSDISKGEMRLQFVTNEPSTAIIEYGATSSLLDKSMVISAINSSAHLVTLGNLQANTKTYYRITATDSSANQRILNGQGKLAPAPVQQLAAYPGDAEVGLIWQASTEVNSYKLYRSSDSGNTFTALNSNQTINQRYYTDTLVANATDYQYYVTAIDADGNESDISNIASVTPDSVLAGPTVLNGGSLDVNTVWLKSKSPYQILDNVKIRKDVELLLLPGTEIEFTAADKHILVAGTITGLGTSADKVTIQSFNNNGTYTGELRWETGNYQASTLNYTTLETIKLMMEDGNTINLSLIDSIVNIRSVVYMGIQKALNTNLNVYGIVDEFGNNYAYYQNRITSFSGGSAQYIDESGNPIITSTAILESNSFINSTISGGGLEIQNGTFDNSTATNARINNVANISNSVLDSTAVSAGYSGGLRIMYSTINQSTINQNSTSSRLVMHFNTLDSATTLNTQGYLDISYNYWGSADLTAIATQTGYSPNPDQNTHLYPIITSSDLYNADHDGDGVPDYLDHDNDDDGYSDLQEDWESDPSYSFVYNPLDENSHPDPQQKAYDNDMDGLADDVDLDDDSDGLSDLDELIRLTNPKVADSDGDGVPDGDEVTYKYNPLNANNYPLMGNISGKTIDNSNTNTDGVVLIAGYETTSGNKESVTLNGVEIAAGVSLLLEKDTSITFNDSVFNGNATNVIKLQQTGSGNGYLSLYNTEVNFSNLKLVNGWNINSQTVIDRSDLYIGRSGSNQGIIKNSSINVSSDFNNTGGVFYSYIYGSSNWYNQRDVSHSYLVTRSVYSYKSIQNSFIKTYVYAADGSSLLNSVVSQLRSNSSNSVKITNSDVELNSSGAPMFFDGAYIRKYGSTDSYSGYGDTGTIDQNGDGVAETTFTMGGTQYTVDGINNPRSEPNFPDLVFKPYLVAAPIWDPKGVGAWWDMNNPDVFPDKDPQNNSGIIKGKIELEGFSDHSGVEIAITNTNLTTVTNSLGEWSISLPSRNYDYGLTISKNHFNDIVKTRTYTVETNQTLDTGTETLTQVTAKVIGTVTVDEASDLALTTIMASKAGYTTTINANSNGTFSFDALPIGDYTFSFNYPNGVWETINYNLNIADGQTDYTISLVRIRNSFVTVNNGDTYTNQLDINLALTNATASTMQISEGGNNLANEAYVTAKTITLSAGDGVKTVTVDYFDASANALTPANDTIILDTTLNLGSLTFSGATTKGDTLHLTLNAGEVDGSATVTIPSLVTDLAMYDDGTNGDTIANDGIYEVDYLIQVADEINALATATFVDHANNTAQIASVSNVVLSTSPTISQLHTASDGTNMVVTFATNEATTATIQYGTVIGVLDQNLVVSATELTEHSVTIPSSNGQTLYFKVTVSDGQTTDANVDSLGTVSNTALTGLNGEAGSEEVGLVWTKQADAVSYNVYRSLDSNLYTLLDTVTADKVYYVDTTATNNQSYHYRVTWVDANAVESDQSTSISVTPSLSLSGPTEMDGGVISGNKLWLKSRSPYQITNNILIETNAILYMMAGTQVEFLGAQRFILVEGRIFAYGSDADNVVITADLNYQYDSGSDNSNESSIKWAINNNQASEMHFVELNYLRIIKNYSTLSERENRLVNLSLFDGTVNSSVYGDYVRSDFYIENAKRITFNEYGSGTIGSNHSYCGFSSRINQLENSTVNKLNSIGEVSSTSYCIIRSGSIVNTTISGGGVYSLGSISESIINNAKLHRVNTITNLTLNNSSIDNESTNSTITNSIFNSSSISSNTTTRINDSQFTGSSINVSGDTTRLTMRYNVLDSTSTLNTAGYLDISHNYWGSTDLTAIALQTGYSSNSTQNTHLYPIITGSDLKVADWDGDGIPDYIDYDNDNDGYSDLQEDWESKPDFGSIYDPLDDQSKPESAKDNDQDGEADDIDLDDDNDGLSDVNEVTYSTDPFLADSDGDGVTDGNEVIYNFNPIDATNYPLMGNISNITIDSSNVNSNGEVYIVGYDNGSSKQSVTLSNVTIAPGTPLVMEKDTPVNINNSSLIGTAGAGVITIRQTGVGSGNLYLNGVTAKYTNMKLVNGWQFDSSTVIELSDFKLSASSYPYNNYGSIKTSLVVSSDFQNYGEIVNSFYSGQLNNQGSGSILSSKLTLTSVLYNNSTIDSSVVEFSSSYLSLSSGSEISNSIISRVYAESSVKINNSDMAFYTSSGHNIFFDNTYIVDNVNGMYDYNNNGLGAPEDQIGDGLAETEITINGTTYYVDGIKNPRNTKNFPNGESDLWNPVGVGAWWDSANPTVFPESVPLD